MKIENLSKSRQIGKWSEISQNLRAADLHMAKAQRLANELGETNVAQQFLDSRLEIQEWVKEARDQRRALEGWTP